MSKKSDFKLVCRPDAFGEGKICRWTCPGKTTGMFISRDRPDWFVIVHPSTKKAGRWQASHFDDEGAIGDVERSSCEAALYDMGVDRRWRLARPRELRGAAPFLVRRS